MKIFNKNSGTLQRHRVPNCDRSLSKVVGCDISSQVTASANPPVLVVEISDRTEAIIRGLGLLLEYHGAPSGILCQLRKQLRDYLNTSSCEGNWMKRAKHALAYPLAKYLRNELPPCPEPVFEPSGPLRRWIKARLNAFNRKNTHLWYSWLQAKRCALPVSDDMIDEAYKKHFSQLTRPDPCLSKEDEETEELKSILSNPTFRRVLNKVRKEITRTLHSDFHENVASTSACFENTRSKQGQYGELRSFLESVPSDTFCLDDPNLIEEQRKDYLGEDQQLTDDLDFFKQKYGLDFDSGKNIPDRVVGSVIPLRGDKSLFAPFIGSDELVRMYHVTAVRERTTHEVQEQHERAGRYRWKMLKELENYRLVTQSDCLYATIQAVLEPLKIRIISKGPAYEYYQMKPLQKAIHSAMRNMPCFRLIGRKICPTDLSDLIPEETEQSLSRDLQWHSVDYSAATDGLSSRLGLSILDYLTSDLAPEIRICASKVLGPHDLYYPERRGAKWGDPQHHGRQTNGQLMGGILSFPILCLANLAVYLRVKESELPPGLNTLRNDKELLAKVLVNGDDMLYIGTEKNWSDHIRIAGLVGLEMSVGKAYRHKLYANANSTSFVCPIQPGATAWQINYLNCGLVFGQHKVQTRTAGTAESHHKDVESCVANIPAILEGALPGRQCELLRYVLSSRRDEILRETEATLVIGRRRTTYHRNLFLPIPVGGMGLDAPVGWKYEVKKIDRRVALSRVLATEAYLEERPTRFIDLVSLTDPIPPWIAKVPEPIPVEFTLIPGKLRYVPFRSCVLTHPSRSARLC